MKKTYESIIIGGGIAGLQAAIQLGRYQRNILVIDSNNGRFNLCKGYHNILGWPDGVSGETLQELGRKQAKSYGVHFLADKVISAGKEAGFYSIITENGEILKTKTILISTGVMDRIPSIKNIRDCLGLTIYVCPDCDGYEVANKNVLVLGAGEAGANLAMMLIYWTNKITYINHDGEELDPSLREQLSAANITYKKEEIIEVVVEDTFKGVKLKGGSIIRAERGFIAFGGNEIRNDIAKQLGVQLLKNKHIVVDSRTKETNVRNVWAAGDIVAHSQQATIAMGEGTQAAIWIHKRLLKENTER